MLLFAALLLFKEYPLTSYDVQIPKSKFCFFLEAFRYGTWSDITDTICGIVELFKTEQAASEVLLLQLEAGGVVAPTR